MLIPPTIMIVAIIRTISTLLLESLIRNPGKTMPRKMLYIATKTGRVPITVETKDIGPLDCAENINTIAVGASTSLPRSMVIVEPFRFISLSCLMVLGRIATPQKTTTVQSTTIVYTFQKER